MSRGLIIVVLPYKVQYDLDATTVIGYGVGDYNMPLIGQKCVVPKTFPCIVADPPWPYADPDASYTALTKTRKVDGSIAKGVGDGGYNSMSLYQIKSLPIKSVSSLNSHLYLWTTNAFIVEAHEVAESWGFKPKTIITWVKKKSDGTPSIKTGYYYRGATEHCLFCVKGSLRLIGPAHPTVFETKRLRHSVKPNYFYKIVERQSIGPRLELFSRLKRKGWYVWGNQVESDVDLMSYANGSNIHSNYIVD